LSESVNDVHGPHDVEDLLLLQTLRTVRTMRGAARRRLLVEEEVREALVHVGTAMEHLVGWMEREGERHGQAMRLLTQLRQAGDALAQCLGACPLDIVIQEDHA
jgi:hypothetical protein